MARLNRWLAPVVVVGGGPAGCVTALYLQKLKIPVVLIDQGKSREKVCGEAIMPSGWQILQELNLDAPLSDAFFIRGIDYYVPSLALSSECLSATLTEPARSLPRYQLIDGLRQKVRDSGIDYRLGWRAQKLENFSDHVELDLQDDQGRASRLRASYVIGADGLHSKVRRWSGLDLSSSQGYQRWGTRCHFQSQEKRSQVSVYLADGFEAYLTPLADQTYGLAFIWSPDLLGRPLEGQGPVYRRLWNRLCQDYPESLPSLEGEFSGQDQAIGPLLQKTSAVVHSSGRVALVGDASGYLDALTGEGLCLSSRQAKALAYCLAQGRLENYQKEVLSIKWRHQLAVRGLLWLFHHQVWRDRVFKSLAASPLQFQALLRWAVEEAPSRTLLTSQTGTFLKQMLRPC